MLGGGMEEEELDDFFHACAAAATSAATSATATWCVRLCVRVRRRRLPRCGPIPRRPRCPCRPRAPTRARSRGTGAEHDGLKLELAKAVMSKHSGEGAVRG